MQDMTTTCRFKVKITRVDVPLRRECFTVYFVDEHGETMWLPVWGHLHNKRFIRESTMILDAIGEDPFRSGEFYTYAKEMKRLCERFKGDIWMYAHRKIIIDKKGYDKEIWKVERIEFCGQGNEE